MAKDILITEVSHPHKLRKSFISTNLRTKGRRPKGIENRRAKRKSKPIWEFISRWRWKEFWRITVASDASNSSAFVFQRELPRIGHEFFRTDENPFGIKRSKYQRKSPLARELFLVASREIEQIYSNLSNLFPICLICIDLYDFCPLGHSFFSHHIATYREHHFQS